MFGIPFSIQGSYVDPLGLSLYNFIKEINGQKTGQIQSNVMSFAKRHKISIANSSVMHPKSK